MFPCVGLSLSLAAQACSLRVPDKAEYFGGERDAGGGAAGNINVGGTGATSSAGTAGSGGSVGGNDAGGAGGVGGTGGSAGEPPTGDAEYCAYQLDLAAQEYDRFRKVYTDPNDIPRSYDGTTSSVSPNDWTSGFVAGSFWRIYEHTKDDSWRVTAETWTQALFAQATRTSDHDIGFIINTSYGNGYRLTESSSYKTVLEQAAESGIKRYSPVIGAIRSWDYAQYTYPVVIDSMMNLELLLRGSELSGNDQYKQIAVTHALTVAANHFRPDSSAYHVVDFDMNGNVISKSTPQGIDSQSAWGRGQTWGLYGYTMLFRESGDERFLSQAQSIADYYTEHPSMPEDGVPYWDLDSPEYSNVPDFRDTSAGAVAASALFELSSYVTGTRKQKYRAFAVKAVRALSGPSYRAAPDTNGHFLLRHAIGSYPEHREVDVALNFADYYYLEALLRCKAMRSD
ncbi:MAG: glycoside hydrolase family 88 protein [Polyangiaceae bacterium]|nr:glycoside hydrolase family 88 protein [Polyangiaceae bacterium]